MKRGLVIALIFSAALNVFALGHLSGRALSPDRSPRSFEGASHRAANPFRFMRHTGELPPEVRERFRDQIRAEFPSMQGHFRLMRQHNDELMVLLAQEEWDGAAVKRKLDEIHDGYSGQRGKMNEAFVNALSELTPEQRQRLVEKSYEEMRHGRRDGRRGKRRHLRSEDG